MIKFPRPDRWTAQSRDSSVTCDHGNKVILFLEGPLSNNYSMQFDTLIDNEPVIVNSATQAVLLHKAALFKDKKSFDAILAAKQFKKMLSLADAIAGYDESAWQEHVQGVMNQVVHEKFLMDLWMFDTLCSTSSYTFKEQPGKPSAVSSAVLENALVSVRDILQKQPAWVRATIHPCHVVNTHYATADVDISRGSIFGNEHVISDSLTRDEAIAQYKIGLKKKIKDNTISMDALLGLIGKRLGCTCVPNACHGHVLRDAVKWASSTTYDAS